MQILSRKVIDDDHVELKARMDVDPIPGSKQKSPTILVQPMLRVGGECKLGGSTRAFKDDWEQSGNIQPVMP